MTKPAVTVVTTNTSKFNQITEALSHYDIRTQLLDVDITEIKSLDVTAVVRDKAVKAYEQAGEPVLVDDSGIYFDAYKDFPGTYSKFLYKTIGFDGILKLVQPGDSAVFISYAAYMDNTLDEPMLFKGEYSGTITEQFDQSKDYEMPYAPMFIPLGESKDMASMTPEERGNDHRHQAIDAFAKWFNERQP
ncbi:MAG: non-canonical purine NTP pyrophosphatase [Candidatus Kerfeldbacteria bacterium]